MSEYETMKKQKDLLLANTDLATAIALLREMPAMFHSHGADEFYKTTCRSCAFQRRVDLFLKKVDGK